METRSRQRPERGPNWTYRRRGVSNLLRLGHCAPAAMQTILDVSSTDTCQEITGYDFSDPGGVSGGVA